LTTSINTGNNSGNYKCLIHIDRLSITFKHWSGSTFQDIRNPDNILSEQAYQNITLMYDIAPGPGAFYHSFKVFHKGFLVGRLHSATKLKKHELQFDFSKEVFYSFYSGYWYEVYAAIMDELGLKYNNIRYVEIALDTDKRIVEQYGYYYMNTCNNNLRTNDLYFMRKNTPVNVMNNGSSFVIGGSENEVVIYKKSNFAEDYIQNYFINNGLNGKEVNRIESRLSWNYIRYMRNKKQLDVNVETLLDPKKLITIFQISTLNKLTFIDVLSKNFDGSRNPQYKKVSVIDDLPLESVEIGILNKTLRTSHYKTELVDENILRQNYFRFLETGQREYLRNFNASRKVAGFNKNQLSDMINKFNHRYNGNRTPEINNRMKDAKKYINLSPGSVLGEMIKAAVFSLKWQVLGLF
jgi:hypothetical protein